MFVFKRILANSRMNTLVRSCRCLHKQQKIKPHPKMAVKVIHPIALVSKSLHSSIGSTLVDSSSTSKQLEEIALRRKLYDLLPRSLPGEPNMVILNNNDIMSAYSRALICWTTKLNESNAKAEYVTRN